jgi:hypothetical protein
MLNFKDNYSNEIEIYIQEQGINVRVTDFLAFFTDKGILFNTLVNKYYTVFTDKDFSNLKSLSSRITFLNNYPTLKTDFINKISSGDNYYVILDLLSQSSLSEIRSFFIFLFEEQKNKELFEKLVTDLKTKKIRDIIWKLGGSSFHEVGFFFKFLDEFNENTKSLSSLIRNSLNAKNISNLFSRNRSAQFHSFVSLEHFFRDNNYLESLINKELNNDIFLSSTLLSSIRNEECHKLAYSLEFIETKYPNGLNLTKKIMDLLMTSKFYDSFIQKCVKDRVYSLSIFLKYLKNRQAKLFEEILKEVFSEKYSIIFMENAYSTHPNGLVNFMELIKETDYYDLFMKKLYDDNILFLQNFKNLENIRYYKFYWYLKENDEQNFKYLNDYFKKNNIEVPPQVIEEVASPPIE